MPEVIERGEPAIMVCHWPGLYFNGDEIGFAIFQDVVRRLQRRYDDLIWMKLSEIARYWAAKMLTHIAKNDEAITLRSPFGCPDFTFEFSAPHARAITVKSDGRSIVLKEIDQRLDLVSGHWVRDDEEVRVCLDLPRRKEVSVTWTTA